MMGLQLFGPDFSDNYNPPPAPPPAPPPPLFPLPGWMKPSPHMPTHSSRTAAQPSAPMHVVPVACCTTCVPHTWICRGWAWP